MALTISGLAGGVVLAILCGMGSSATAQDVKPSAIPQDTEASSEAAMALTVHDPRIAASKAESGWGMWDIGRPHPLQGKGAFKDHDPIGLAAGKLIPTDCSLTWTDPDNHRIICFASQASLVYFLAEPKMNEKRAEKGWQELQKKPES